MTSKEIRNNDLYAFIDDQLDSETHARLLAAIRQDKRLEHRINKLRHMKALISFAHRDPPLPSWTPSVRSARKRGSAFRLSAAAVLVLAVAVSTGMGYGFMSRQKAPVFQDISHFDPGQAGSDRILLHISSMDPDRIHNTLNTVEKLLDNSKKNRRTIQVEVVAAAEGLTLLREGSAFEQRIHSIASGHDNVAFLACGVAMQNAALKEGAKVELLPDADKVDAALETILNRLRQGWHYIRG